MCSHHHRAETSCHAQCCKHGSSLVIHWGLASVPSVVQPCPSNGCANPCRNKVPCSPFWMRLMHGFLISLHLALSSPPTHHSCICASTLSPLQQSAVLPNAKNPVLLNNQCWEQLSQLYWFSFQ